VTASADRGKPPLRPSEGLTFSPATVLEALAQIIASQAFRASARRKRLLKFLVEETVAGRADRLKPYAIAIDALGCDETFNPQIDPLVRLEVGRLRRDLEHYYLTDGRDDALRITKGGSVPAFERRGLPPKATPQVTSPSPPTRRRWRQIALGVLLPALALGLAGALLFFVRSGGDHGRGSARASEPAVLVMPLEASGDDGSRLLASGLTNQLITILMRFDALQVFAGAPAAASAYVVTGRVAREPDRIRVTARLTQGKRMRSGRSMRRVS
jgi:adenylate cyclase